MEKMSKIGDVKNHWKGRISELKVTNQGWLAKVHIYLVKDMVLDAAQHTPLHSYCKYFYENVYNLSLKKCS